MDIKVFCDITITNLRDHTGKPIDPKDKQQQVIPFNNLKAIIRQRVLQQMDTFVKQAEVQADGFNVITSIVIVKE